MKHDTLVLRSKSPWGLHPNGEKQLFKNFEFFISKYFMSKTLKHHNYKKTYPIYDHPYSLHQLLSNTKLKP